MLNEYLSSHSKYDTHFNKKGSMDPELYGEIMGTICFVVVMVALVVL